MMEWINLGSIMDERGSTIQMSAARFAVLICRNVSIQANGKRKGLSCNLSVHEKQCTTRGGTGCLPAEEGFRKPMSSRLEWTLPRQRGCPSYEVYAWSSSALQRPWVQCRGFHPEATMQPEVGMPLFCLRDATSILWSHMVDFLIAGLDTKPLCLVRRSELSHGRIVIWTPVRTNANGSNPQLSLAQKQINSNFYFKMWPMLIKNVIFILVGPVTWWLKPL